MAAQEIPLAGTRLLSRNSVAEGTMAFHFARPAGFTFKAGQAADLTLLNPPRNRLRRKYPHLLNCESAF